jgi:Ca2+-binding EF-hand superfamily protein
MTRTSPTFFSADQSCQLRDAFAAFAQKAKSLPKAALGPLLHAVGVNAVPWEVQDMEHDIGESFDIDVFRYLVYRASRGSDPELELSSAVSLFDREGNGTMSEADFRSILAGLKDPYTPAQIYEVINLAGFNAENPTVDRGAFVKALMEL